MLTTAKWYNLRCKDGLRRCLCCGNMPPSCKGLCGRSLSLWRRRHQVAVGRMLVASPCSALVLTLFQAPASERIFGNRAPLLNFSRSCHRSGSRAGCPSILSPLLFSSPWSVSSVAGGLDGAVHGCAFPGVVSLNDETAGKSNVLLRNASRCCVVTIVCGWGTCLMVIKLGVLDTLKLCGVAGQP